MGMGIACQFATWGHHFRWSWSGLHIQRKLMLGWVLSRSLSQFNWLHRNMPFLNMQCSLLHGLSAKIINWWLYVSSACCEHKQLACLQWALWIFLHSLQWILGDWCLKWWCIHLPRTHAIRAREEGLWNGLNWAQTNSFKATILSRFTWE